ncbi:indole-3-glycerol phosphate synthase [Halocalculus aciditolerans]|uniref:Indole-3-glycerol phosphate synthase n=1 Tax=Halocalculus aciditolerans TaxID=1383812 RepID=A0A830F7Y5_9EURY|nr:indole-3-glycerol phosphate synthase [Halocalculus aciditolerans]GGL72174.1 indole-3-glycerol-phosphate synthase [Halocalculus aciditolerans]
MNDGVELAPAVQSILDSADDRPGGAERVSVDARSLDEAFAAADADGRVPVIAEVKPTSPTTEGERTEDPVALAEAMVRGGAAALSVLTEPTHFGGSVENLERVRAAVDVPVLRKDFLLRTEHLDVAESDVALLIARFLETDEADSLEAMHAAALERGFQPLVEVHTRAELERAVSVDAEYIGVNNRDLAELVVDLGTFEDLAPHAPDHVTLVAESGIGNPEDVRRMRDAGADALLVGSAIMADGDVEANTRELVSA